MKEAELIKAAYERIVQADFPYSAPISDGSRRIKAVDDSGCHGDGKNLLFLSFDLVDGRVANVHYECEYCDVTMYVTAELVCGLMDGRTLYEIGEIAQSEVITALGGNSRKILRQVRTALELVADS